MKDCKRNPPTNGSKGIHLDEHGTLVERSDLAGTPVGTRMLKRVSVDGSRRACRKAEKQAAIWAADGTYEKFLSGELDPPAGWVLHTHGAASLGASDASKKTLAVCSKFVDELLDIGYYWDDNAWPAPGYRRPTLAMDPDVLDASLLSLLAQGRLSEADLQEALRHNLPTSLYSNALSLTGSPTSALELLVRHRKFVSTLEPSDPRLNTKLQLLKAAPSTMHDPQWSALVSPTALLDHAVATGMDPSRFAEIVSRTDTIARSAGITDASFSGVWRTSDTGPLTDTPFAITYLSLLADPVEQRALAVVLAAADRSDCSPAELAKGVANLPAGANDLDSLVRYTAAHLHAGHIHGDRQTATTHLLECLAGNTPAPSASVAAAASWAYGPLGTVSAHELVTGSSSSTSSASRIMSAVAHASTLTWDTVLLGPVAPAGNETTANGPGSSGSQLQRHAHSREEVLLAAALAAHRATAAPQPTASQPVDDMTPAPRQPDPEFSRMLLEEEIREKVLLLETRPSFRELARTAVEEASIGADSSVTLAHALLDDSLRDHGEPEWLATQVGRLSSFLTTGSHHDSVRCVGTTTEVISALVDDVRALAADDTPAAPLLFAGLPDPEHAQRLYHQARAAAGDVVGTAVELYTPYIAQVLDLSLALATHVPDASLPTVPVLSLALAPGVDASAVAARARVSLAAAGIDAAVKLRENEVVVVADGPAKRFRDIIRASPTQRSYAARERISEDIKTATTSAKSALTSEFAADNREAFASAKDRAVSFAAVKAAGGDPEFERMLDEDLR